MEQSGKSMIQVPRELILGMLVGPLLPGFMVVMKIIDDVSDPRFHGVRGPDFIRLFAIGLCAGIVFSGLMLFINSKVRQS